MEGGEILNEPYVVKDSLTLSIKLKLSANYEQKALLLRTMDSYRDAMNYVSRYAFTQLDKRANKRKLNDLLYRELRIRYNLPSQLAQSAIRRVASTYQGEWTKIKQNAEHRKLGYTKKYYHGLEKAPEFKSRTTEIVYGRDYSFGKNQTASVNTLEGRVRVAYEGWTPHVERLRSGEWKIGTAKLWYDKRRKALYLIVPITREQSVDLNDMTQVQGVDVGMRYLAVVGTGEKPIFVKGSPIHHKKRHLQRLRKRLQEKGTRSAKRRLAALSRRERRLTSDVNHRLSRKIAQPQVLVGIEDLTHIRVKINTKRKDTEERRQAEQWAFADLHSKILYKSSLYGGYATRQDAHYTSQGCPRCEHTSKNNRPGKGLLFTCEACGYTLHADLVGGRNVRLRTLVARQGRTITGRVSTVPDVDSNDTGPDPVEESRNPLTLVRGS